MGLSFLSHSGASFAHQHSLIIENWTAVELDREKFRWHCSAPPWSLGLGVKCSTEEETEELSEPLVLKDIAGSFQERKRALASMQELLMVQVKVTDAPALGMSAM